MNTRKYFVSALLIGILVAAAWFLFTAMPAQAQQSCAGPGGVCAEDPVLQGCTQCHSYQIQGGNRNGTARQIWRSSGAMRHELAPKRTDWTTTVQQMISKGSSAVLARTAGYLNTNYCTTCTGPILSSISAPSAQITTTTATIIWSTSASGFEDEPATSVLYYGTNQADVLLGPGCSSCQVVSDPTMVAHHAVNLSGLSPDTRYYVVNESTSALGTTRSKYTLDFRTAPDCEGGGDFAGLRFDGTDDYMQVPHSDSLKFRKEMTIEARVSISDHEATRTIVSKNYSNSPANYELVILASSGKLRFRQEMWDGQDEQQTDHFAFTSTTAVPTGQLTAVAVVVNTSSLQFYIDGVQAGSFALPYGSQTEATAWSTPVYNTPVRIGKIEEYGVNAPYYFGGDMDEVRIWNGARSSAAILADKDAELTGTEANLRGYWKFNEGSGTVANDSTANGNHGAVSGATFLSGGGPCGPGFAGLRFDGTDDYVQVPHSDSLKFRKEMTIEARVSISDHEATRTIVSKNYSNSPANYELVILASSGKLRFRQEMWDGQDEQQTDHFAFTSTTAVPTGQLTAVAVVVNTSSLQFYIDGVQAGSFALPYGSQTEATAWSTPVYNTPVRIGKIEEYGVNAPYYFGGDMDEVRIWNGARSSAAILADKDAELTGTEANLRGYWKFNEGSGTVANDSTANNNDGTVYGATFFGP
jgi:hypothetical protein